MEDRIPESDKARQIFLECVGKLASETFLYPILLFMCTVGSSQPCSIEVYILERSRMNIVSLADVSSGLALPPVDGVQICE